jgi:hypothetical protein
VEAKQLDADAKSTGGLPQYMFYVPSLTDGGFGPTVVGASSWLQAFLEPKLLDPKFFTVSSPFSLVSYIKTMLNFDIRLIDPLLHHL